MRPEMGAPPKQASDSQAGEDRSDEEFRVVGPQGGNTIERELVEFG